MGGPLLAAVSASASAVDSGVMESSELGDGGGKEDCGSGCE